MQSFTLHYGPDSIVFREGDPSMDIFYLQSGKLLICTIHGTEVKAISRIEAGEFFGELSFFDGRPRSSYIVTLETSTIIQIPKQELTGKLPQWYLEVGKNLTKKIRLLDHIIQDTKIRKTRAAENRPLSIDEQRKLFELLTK